VQLDSRARVSPDKFAEAFLATLAPGVLPAAQFIDWVKVDSIAADIGDPQGPVMALQRQLTPHCSPRRVITEFLSHASDPCGTVEQLFFLLGHTRPVFVTYEYEISLKSLARQAGMGDEDACNEIADALVDAGIEHVLRATSLRDVAIGVRIGLDTHRRKSTGGSAFSVLVGEILDEAVLRMSLDGIEMEKRAEQRVAYGENLHKKVDFALYHAGDVLAVIEINFYTGGGSKPSEISRAYSELARKFGARGTPFIWITDGRGWRDMRNVVREMPYQVPNVYNARQAHEHLEADLRALISESRGLAGRL
jgi:hypothetical protein